MKSLPLSFWVARADILVQAATLIVAVIAARRHALKGLWILVLSLLLAVLLSVTDLFLTLMIRSGHYFDMSYMDAFGHVPLLIMIAALCGWCFLAFSRKNGAKSDLISQSTTAQIMRRILVIITLLSTVALVSTCVVWWRGDPRPSGTYQPPLPIVTQYDNIADLKGIKSLKILQTYSDHQSWVSWNTNINFKLKGINGREIFFTANCIDAEVLPQGGYIRELELHSPWLNINQVRELGLQIIETFGFGSRDFLSWCDKIGDRRIDINAFSSGVGHSSDTRRVVGFSVHPTFNNDKPLYVRVIVRDR